MIERRTIAFGLAVACMAGWGLALALPWLHAGGASLAQGQLLHSAVGYERALVMFPLVGLPVAAAGLVAAQVLPARWRPLATLAAVLGAGVASVGGARMLGFTVVRALDLGPADTTPGWAPIAVVAVGACTAIWASAQARQAGNAIPPLAAVAWTTLVAMPFLPFGASGSGSFLYDELSLAATAATGGGLLAPAGQAFAWFRAALWVAAGGAMAWTAWGARGGQAPAWARLALFAPGALGALPLAALGLARWAAVDGLDLCWNAAVPLGAMGCAASLVGPLRAAAARHPTSVFKDQPE